MISFILRRLAQFLVTLLVASFLLFAVTEFSPGNVASKILGPYAVQSQVDLLYDKLDLGAPLLERYGQWLGTLLGLSENRLGDPAIGRSEERRVGTECVGTCRSRWAASH